VINSNSDLKFIENPASTGGGRLSVKDTFEYLVYFTKECIITMGNSLWKMALSTVNERGKSQIQ
jgi:hypothetical protein